MYLEILYHSMNVRRKILYNLLFVEYFIYENLTRSRLSLQHSEERSIRKNEKHFNARTVYCLQGL